VARVVSPTAIELEANDTVTVEIRFASALMSSVVIPSDPVTLFSEQEKMAISARMKLASLVSLRVMVPPMNRATASVRARQLPNCVQAETFCTRPASTCRNRQRRLNGAHLYTSGETVVSSLRVR
jgi:hypothetical protein